MEAHSGLSAKIVEEAVSRHLWASGLTISASLSNEASWTPGPLTILLHREEDAMLTGVKRKSTWSSETPRSSVLSTGRGIHDPKEIPDGVENRTALQSGLFSGLSFTALLRATGWVPNSELSAAESESTLFRFFRSAHIRDLKLIGTAAFVVFMSHLVLVLILGAVAAANSVFAPGIPEQVLPWGKLLLGLWKRTFAAGSQFFFFMFTYVGPAIPIYGLIIGWAYQSASKRLGIVDLFACEIGTLCRVGTIFDIGKRYVERYYKPSSENGGAPENGPASRVFVSKEEYFPVFQSNSRDLQLLEASVVNDITQFYTYMKALRDTQRRLAEMKPPQMNETDVHKSNCESETDPWHTTVVSMIYLTFLGYESARKAIGNLVEYQPARAERLIVILLTELKCFSFLRQHFKPDDLRCRRLQLRKADYREQVLDVYDQVVGSPHGQNEKDWVQAKETIPDLESRYEEALGESLAAASKKRRETLESHRSRCIASV